MAGHPATVYPRSDEKRTQLLCVLIVTTTVALVSFFLRMYARLRILKGLGWDDYTMIASIVSRIPLTRSDTTVLLHWVQANEAQRLTVSPRCSPSQC
jgi:nicotinamide riboside transporter PnuC